MTFLRALSFAINLVLVVVATGLMAAGFVAVVDAESWRAFELLGAAVCVLVVLLWSPRK